MSSLLTRDQMPDWLKSTYRTLDRSEKEILAAHNSVAAIEKKSAELTRALRGEAAVLRAEEEAEKEPCEPKLSKLELAYLLTAKMYRVCSIVSCAV